MKCAKCHQTISPPSIAVAYRSKSYCPSCFSALKEQAVKKDQKISAELNDPDFLALSSYLCSRLCFAGSLPIIIAKNAGHGSPSNSPRGIFSSLHRTRKSRSSLSASFPMFMTRPCPITVLSARRRSLIRPYLWRKKPGILRLLTDAQALNRAFAWRIYKKEVISHQKRSVCSG